ncbi:hypothetical protein NV379_07990 [Paenibacillus sp. N1-5-1-14]|uniref:hypothetical protein n=1 Tax=Paenibacillus radicibacter TaxID=2972488 RepID=UPI002158F468|nr:hypothetical protein [Paenibacillus radicibacter]MCR8642602.1 hypothetical protein [Paenibacillus radicibacter]
MGVKFGREYSDIQKELTAAISKITDVHVFLEMEAADWDLLAEDEQLECIGTLTDDLFYALGTEPVCHVGSGSVRYDHERHVIIVRSSGGLATVISLI